MPACTTPELWPVWCAARRSSFSSTTTSVPGRRRTTSRAIATPRIPPPTTPTRLFPHATRRSRLAPAHVKPHFGGWMGVRDLHVPAGPGLPDGLVVPAAELVERFSKSPGPGGQSVNTTDSRVELELDVAAVGGPHRHPARPRPAALARRARVDRGLRAPLAAPQPRRRARAAGRDAARGPGATAAAAARRPGRPAGRRSGGCARRRSARRPRRCAAGSAADPTRSRARNPGAGSMPAAAWRTTSPFACAVSASSAA